MVSVGAGVWIVEGGVRVSAAGVHWLVGKGVVLGVGRAGITLKNLEPHNDVRWVGAGVDG